MSERKQKRFWTQAVVAGEDGEFTIELDGRPIRTPAKARFLVPTRSMAGSIAGEWNAQGELVDPMTMPFTRSANAAIDKVATQHFEVAEMLAAYGDSDLLCYRAQSPQALVDRQSAAWDPALDWAKSTLGSILQTRSGIMHEPQPAAALAALSSRVHAMTAFELAAFHDLVSLSGSLVLGFAAALNWRESEEIWILSRLDELWQEEQWGPDEEARALAETKKQAFLHAKRFFDLSRAGDGA